MRRNNEEFNDQNYDSFLDIVANLVGILVILIMVIGVRAKKVANSSPESVAAAIETAKLDQAKKDALQSKIAAIDRQFEEKQNAPVIPMAAIRQLQHPAHNVTKTESLRQQLHVEKTKAAKINTDAHEMNANIQQLRTASKYQNEERQRLQLAISLAEKAIAKRRSKLGEQQQVELAMAQELDSSKHALGELHRQISAVESLTKKPPKVLEHKSTPLAKTVFGEEEHFRISGGRIAYVPMPEIVSIMQRDVSSKKWKLQNQNEATEVIGPVNGFYGRYTIEKRRGIVQTDDGPRMAEMIELREIDMVPEENTVLGEAVDGAIQSTQSEFLQRIAYLNPETTTITFWVYPDGYADFRKVKEALTGRGFRTAARVLRDGYLIGGAPGGSKSAAE